MFCLEAVDVFFNMKAWATAQTSIDWIKKTWHPYLDKMKDDFEKDGSQSCSHFVLKHREIASHICYFPVWNGLATAH